MAKLVKRRGFKIIISSIAIIVLSIILFNTFNNGKSIKSSQDFLKELKSKGYSIETIDIPRRKTDYFDGYISHKAIEINKFSYINIYEFEKEEQAKAAAETIAKDAFRVGTAYLDWGTAVKFYRKGNIIVQYEGTSFKSLWHLRNIMGKSVASSPIDFLIFMKFFKNR